MTVTIEAQVRHFNIFKGGFEGLTFTIQHPLSEGMAIVPDDDLRECFVTATRNALHTGDIFKGISEQYEDVLYYLIRLTGENCVNCPVNSSCPSYLGYPDVPYIRDEFFNKKPDP